jgi:glycosyltransferase involved in cell wall biosynthesis
MPRQKKLHIARLIDVYGPNFSGGGQTHVRNLSEALKKHHNCQSQIFSQTSLSMLARAIWTFWVIPKIILQHQKTPFDLIHSHGINPGVAACLVGKILKVPVVHSVHGSHLMDQKDTSLKGKLEKFLLTDIPYDLEISDSQSFLRYKSRAKQVVAIPNGVDLDKFKTLKKRHSPKIPVFLVVARLEPVKGIDLLIKAFARVKDQIDKFQVKIIGFGPEEARLKKLIATHGSKPAQAIELLGKVTGEAYFETFKTADIFVLPSRAEGQPISLLDAWSAKLPVLVTNVGHNPFMVKNDHNGYLAEPSAESLAKTLVHAYKHRAQWPKLGENGYNFIQRNNTWKIVAGKVYSEYKKVLELSSKS